MKNVLVHAKTYNLLLMNHLLRIATIDQEAFMVYLLVFNLYV